MSDETLGRIVSVVAMALVLLVGWLSYKYGVWTGVLAERAAYTEGYKMNIVAAYDEGFQTGKASCEATKFYHEDPGNPEDAQPGVAGPQL